LRSYLELGRLIDVPRALTVSTAAVKRYSES
jgi:hypothetical protein